MAEDDAMDKARSAVAAEGCCRAVTAKTLLLNIVGPWQTHCSQSKSVAMTFDDGPKAHSTPILLEALDRVGIKATMFVNGRACRGNATLLREMEDCGHAIANHGYIHKSHAFRSLSYVRNSILQTHFTLEDFGVHPAKLFRPPYGSIDWNTSKHARTLGFVPVLWSAHVADWKPQQSERILTRIGAALEDRMILLLHDGNESLSAVIDALPWIRDEVFRRGWSFVKLSNESPHAESPIGN